MRMLPVLSHGHASVEKLFSINCQVVVDSERAVISHIQEHPHDHVCVLDVINIDNVTDQVGLSWSLPSHIY